jgi:hypothetical protein
VVANIMLPSIANLAATLAANSSDAVTKYADVASWVRKQYGYLLYQASSNFFSVHTVKITYLNLSRNKSVKAKIVKNNYIFLHH